MKHNYENKMWICYVVHNEESSECQYSCHFFYSDGILCAHMLLVFTSNLLRQIPPTYIVNRSTKTVAKTPIYKFDSVSADACGEIAQ